MSKTNYKKTAAVASPVDYVGLGIDENGIPYIIDENGLKTIIINAVNDKGWFATEAALIAAYPPAGATDGWYAIVGATDTVWVFDSGTVAWVNSGASSSSFLSEIQAAAEKTTLVDADKVGLVDVTGTPVTKWASLLNLYNYLKGKFDSIYQAIITNSDDITEGTTNLYNQIPSGGGIGQTLIKTSLTDFALGWATSSYGIPNIIANKGIGTDASKPVTGLVAGDTFVSNDTFKEYTALTATTWNTGVDLIISVFINDTSGAENLLYQYNGSALGLTGDGTGTPGGGVANIVANQGVGTAATKPVTGLTVGDIYVSNDSFLKFTATGATTWDAGVALTSGVFVNDTSGATNELYQYDGTALELTGDGTGSSGGGHTWYENGVIVESTPRTKLNIITNETIPAVEDNAGDDAIDFSQYFENGLDVHPTGKQAGDLWGQNATNDRLEPKAVAPDEKILPVTIEPNLSANGLLTGVIIPAGYKIASITVQETAGNAAGNISIGTAALGAQVVNAFTVGASADLNMTLVADYFSSVNDTDLYVSSSAWGTGVIQLNFVLQKTI